MITHWPINEVEPDLLAVLAKSRGWLPLVKDETMTVTIHGKKYEITRKT